MEEKIVKLGIVGAGRGRALGHAIRNEKNAKIVCLCDRSDKVIQEAIEVYDRFNITGYDIYHDYEEMLAKADINAVVVATDKPFHTEHVIMALRAGKHVISEVPAVTNIEDAKRLKAEVLAHPELKYMMAENCCYWALIDSWKKMREQGKLGEIVYAEAEYIHATHPDEIVAPTPEGAKHWRLNSQAISYLTHELGPLLLAMDDRCISVTCMEPDIPYDPHRKKAGVGVALFKTAKGAVIRILINFGSFAGYDHNYALYGTRGTVMTDKSKSTDAGSVCFGQFYDIPGTFGNPITIPVGTAYPGESTEGHGGAEVKMMREFIDCVLNDKKPTIDIDFALKVSLPGVFAEMSAQQGGIPLEIPEI